MRILEATIAVLIVSGVLIVVYSRQMDRGADPTEYFYSLQKQVLMDVSSNSDLRLMVLNDDEVGLGYFVDEEIPLAFSYYLRLCDLGDVEDYCKIDDVDVVRAIQDKEIFVEEVIISADLGDGVNATYAPKKVRLFVWEGRRVGLFEGENCSDGNVSQDESDVDCGGFFCDGCALGLNCVDSGDCVSLNCTGNVCAEGVSEFCGNGVIDGAEVCDTLGPVLGGEDCVSQGFSGGLLDCSGDCLTYDTSGCS